MMSRILVAAGAPPVGAPLSAHVATLAGGPQRSQVAFQLLLTLALLAVGLYAVALRRRIPLLGNLAALVTMVALYLVWRPSDATAFAEWLGIGRGVDVIFYCWVIISMVMILNLHLKIRIQTETLTELVRRLAIAQPYAEAGSARNARHAGNGGRADGAGRADLDRGARAAPVPAAVAGSDAPDAPDAEPSQRDPDRR